MPRPNPLLRHFRHYGEDRPRIHKYLDYFEVYHRHFERFTDRPITFVEFGVNQGGSLEMWKDYLHDDSRIIGVDIDDRCRQFAGGNVTIEIGDQEDREFLRGLAADHGPIDVVVEDGGHTMGQQIATFEEIYPRMSPEGCFLTEDVHTSYWPKYGGGHRQPGTFMEHAKGLCDQLNAWYARTDDHEVDEFALTTQSIHFYTSVVVFERRERTKPQVRKRGRDSFDLHDGRGRD